MEGPSLLCNRAELNELQALCFYILFAWQDQHLLLQTSLCFVVFSPRTIPELRATETRWRESCKSPKFSLKVAQEPAQSQSLLRASSEGKQPSKIPRGELNMGGEHSMGDLCHSCSISKVDSASLCTLTRTYPKQKSY